MVLKNLALYDGRSPLELGLYPVLLLMLIASKENKLIDCQLQNIDPEAKHA